MPVPARCARLASPPERTLAVHLKAEAENTNLPPTLDGGRHERASRGLPVEVHAVRIELPQPGPAMDTLSALRGPPVPRYGRGHVKDHSPGSIPQKNNVCEPGVRRVTGRNTRRSGLGKGVRHLVADGLHLASALSSSVVGLHFLGDGRR